MPHAEVAGQRISYVDSGGDGPAIVFAHGFLMDHEMFAPQIEALSDEFRCVAWDERGFGETPATGPFTYWDLARDALGLMTHLGIERAFLVGMSQGGFLSLRAALLEPERVLGLGLIDTQAGVEEEAALQGYRALKEQWMTGGPTDELAGIVANIIMSPGYDHSLWVAKWRARPPEFIDLPFECLAGRDDITGRLAEITCPAIVFHGTADAAITMDKAEALCEGLKGCEDVVRIEGAGHASNLSHPDEVSGPLRGFCRRHAQHVQ